MALGSHHCSPTVPAGGRRRPQRLGTHVAITKNASTQNTFWGQNKKETHPQLSGVLQTGPRVPYLLDAREILLQSRDSLVQNLESRGKRKTRVSIKPDNDKHTAQPGRGPDPTCHATEGGTMPPREWAQPRQDGRHPQAGQAHRPTNSETFTSKVF